MAILVSQMPARCRHTFSIAKDNKRAPGCNSCRDDLGGGQHAPHGPLRAGVHHLATLHRQHAHPAVRKCKGEPLLRKFLLLGLV